MRTGIKIFKFDPKNVLDVAKFTTTIRNEHFENETEEIYVLIPNDCDNFCLSKIILSLNANAGYFLSDVEKYNNDTLLFFEFDENHDFD